MNRLKNFSKELKKFNAKRIQAKILTITKNAPNEENRFAVKKIRFQGAKLPKGFKDPLDFAVVTATGEFLEFPDNEGITELSDIYVGMPVTLENGKPCPDGDYIMPQAEIWTVKNGKLTKITPIITED